jgi:DNA-binding response OmpR family regulator
MKVLLVDDEIDFVTTLSNRLGMRGIKTDVVHDGQEALDYVEEDEPDVIVLDLKMPGMYGMEVLRRLSKTNPPGCMGWRYCAG